MSSSERLLDGVWKLTSHCGRWQCDMPLPGDIFSALLSAELIPDPYYGTNENLVQWVGETDWILSREFRLDEETIDDYDWYLDLSRVDTFATISLNNQNVLSTSNCFSRYQPFVKPLLRPGSNQISIRFNRVDLEALSRAKKLPFEIPWSKGNNTIPHMNMVRKVQCHAGWDWGITLMVAGIYDSVALRRMKTARLDYLTHEQFHDGRQVRIVFHADLTARESGYSTLLFTFNQQVREISQKVEAGENRVSCEFIVEQPKLWWPAGHGEQPLYPVEVKTSDGQLLTQKVGLRKLEVDHSEDDLGRRFVIKINDREIFCKGANWIPSDAMPSRQAAVKHRQLLEDAVAANMNMVRVWGGGQYEYDHFYELCDELGLMVWQDAMFSCTSYPSEAWFLNEVRDELAYQVRRLSHHSSLVLWCGDNEVIGSLGWHEVTRNNPARYIANYDRVNQAVSGTIQQYDQSRIFWPSSPCNGPLDFGDGWHVDTSGDMHFWDVWHSGKSFDAYYTVKPRFCSEFGFQSFPSFPGVATYASEDQWNLTSPVMEHHQKNARGNSIIVEMFTRLFRMPSTFAGQLYLSQVQQAMAIRAGIEYWRSTRPVCMGTLYWQLNDNWPVASWSSIEYGGRWKQLHYHARQAYNPVLVTAHIRDGALQAWGINDDASDGEVTCSGGLYSLTGELLKPVNADYGLNGESACRLEHFLLADIEHSVEQCFFMVRYAASTGQGSYTGEKLLFLTEPKRMALPQSEITTDCSDLGSGEFAIDVSANKPAFYVTLEVASDRGVFSDNSFVLLPGEVRHLTFKSRDGIDLATLSKELRVYDLASATGSSS